MVHTIDARSCTIVLDSGDNSPNDLDWGTIGPIGKMHHNRYTEY